MNKKKEVYSNDNKSITGISILSLCMLIAYLSCSPGSGDTIGNIHQKYVFVDMHAHPERFHRANVSQISQEEIGRYLNNHMDVAVCCVSSDAAYQGGYVTRDGTNVRRLRSGEDYDIEPGDAYAFTLDRFSRIIETTTEENAALALSPESVLEAKKQGKLSLIAALEGADGLEGNIEHLQELYGKGLRLLQLVNFRANELGFIQTRPYQAGGLTPFGEEVVRECNRLGIVIDLAHAHMETTMDVVAVSQHPVLFSHTGVKALHEGDRYLSDEEIKAIAEKGGIIGIWPTSSFADMNEMVQHIEYVKDLAGIDHIGIGSDLRGMSYLKEFGEEAHFDSITYALLDHGFSEEETGKIMGGNFFRVWQEITGENR
ncbi:dipeptidase [candidate division KSB1 bacterium]